MSRKNLFKAVNALGPEIVSDLLLAREIFEHSPSCVDIARHLLNAHTQFAKVAHNMAPRPHRGASRAEKLKEIATAFSMAAFILKEQGQTPLYLFLPPPPDEEAELRGKQTASELAAKLEGHVEKLDSLAQRYRYVPREPKGKALTL